MTLTTKKKDLINDSNTPIISIGLPVYKNEKLIQKRLENILSQSFQDFELIISVDPSNDSTLKICKEFSDKDYRIKYFEQNKKMGWIWSFRFVAKKAIGKYFVWAASDDFWDPQFLEKHIQNLETDSTAVGCISKQNFIGKFSNEFKILDSDPITTRIYKKFRLSFRPMNVISISGTSFIERATKILRNTSYHFYAVYRRKEFQESLIDEEFFVWDFAVMLNLSKFGNINLLDDYLVDFFWDDTSTTRQGIFHQFKIQNTRLNEYIFPYSTFIYWCLTNLGLTFSLKNLDIYLWLNFLGATAIGMDLFVHLKKYFSRRHDIG